MRAFVRTVTLAAFAALPLYAQAPIERPAQTPGQAVPDPDSTQPAMTQKTTPPIKLPKSNAWEGCDGSCLHRWLI